MICKRIPRSTNKYKYTAHHVDAQQLLCIAWLKTSSIAHQYTPLLTLLDRHILPMEANAAYLPSCELHSHDSRSLTVKRYSIEVRRYRLRMQILRS